MKGIVLCLVMLLLLSGNSFSQSRKAQIKSAVGTVTSSEGGSSFGTVCLKIKGKEQCFEWSETSTKFQGFNNLPQNLWERSWSKGAQWRITYSIDNSSGSLLLRSAVFTKRLVK